MQNSIAVNEIFMECTAILPLHPRLGRLLDNILMAAADEERGREERSLWSGNVVPH